MTAVLTEATAAQAIPRPPALAARGLAHEVRLPGDRRLQLLDGCSLAVHAGTSLAVVGRSGSGKSSLLSLLGLLAEPTAGEVLLHGRTVTGLAERERTAVRRRSLGFVFQNYALLPHVDVLANVLLPAATLTRAERATAAVRAGELLAAVGLGDRARSRPADLSGGEQQRVAIARALVNAPGVVLADEPTGSLDGASADRVLALLVTQAAVHGVALIVVTHDERVARGLDRRVELERGRLRGDVDG